MTEAHTNEGAAMLLLIRELSGGMQALRESGAKSADDAHAIRVSMAGIEAKLEPIGPMVSQMADISTRMALAEMALKKVDDHEERIGELESQAAKQAGWQGFGGNLLYIVGGAAVSGIVAAIALALRQ